MTGLNITAEQRAYLGIQQGQHSDLVSDPITWQAAYEASLHASMASIKPHLPDPMNSVLDVGSGLGGINILLSRLNPDLEVVLLDGESDAPMVRKHRETFNDMTVARAFLLANGVKNFSYFTPSLMTPRPFDLIISSASWCFHLEPSTYLQFVKSCCRPGTTIIVDVRASKPAWQDLLEHEFNFRAVAHTSRKFNRLVFDAR